MGQAVEALVIGAGYAGLASALALHDAGRDLVVLEARDRVGGRVHTEHHDGAPLDLGGMWVGATHDRFRALLARFGIGTFPTPEHGHAGWWDQDAGMLRRAHLVPAPWSAIPAAAAAVARIEQLSRRVPVDEPWRMPAADRWDAVTVADWIRRRVPSKEARALLDSALLSSLSVDLSQVSMLALCTSAADAGGLLRLLGTHGGAQQDLVVGGADTAARSAAEMLGDRVRLTTPVRSLRLDGDGVHVETDDGSWSARVAVVALPPPHVASLQWQPNLPAQRRQLLARQPMGSVTKLLAVYDTPFWRDAGWSGEAVDAHGPITTAFDATQPGGPPVLASLTCGRRSVALAELSSDERRAMILGVFADWFGPDAAQPRSVVDRSWENERWSGGGYSAIPVPGSLTAAMAQFAEPVGPVHFAGTETAARSGGFIDGAIASGERAAVEILRRLGART